MGKKWGNFLWKIIVCSNSSLSHSIDLISIFNYRDLSYLTVLVTYSEKLLKTKIYMKFTMYSMWDRWVSDAIMIYYYFFVLFFHRLSMRSRLYSVHPLLSVLVNIQFHRRATVLYYPLLYFYFCIQKRLFLVPCYNS